MNYRPSWALFSINMKVSGVGVGLRSEHYGYLQQRPATDIRWFEALTENYLDTRGRPYEILKIIRSDYPVALHGVGMSIASSDGLDNTYMQKLKKFSDEFEPFLISDHLCWARNGRHNLHDLLPPVYNEANFEIISQNVRQAQDILQRQLTLENISAYIRWNENTMSEEEFLFRLAEETKCGILLDVNNIFVNAANYNEDALATVKTLAGGPVNQMHLAGHTNTGKFLFDTHSRPVCDGVWELFKEAVKIQPNVPVLIEWDDEIPEWDVLQDEALKAEKIMQEVSAHVAG